VPPRKRSKSFTKDYLSNCQPSTQAHSLRRTNLIETSHPDTVKLTEGQTVEQAAEHYIELTKAYKALTDEVVRKNFLEYGHPDGKQTVQVGLALPPWVVDAHNNIWVLGLYGVVIGGVLPYIVVSVLSRC
jgi:preprotein translocase subunit Sec63